MREKDLDISLIKVGCMGAENLMEVPTRSVKTTEVITAFFNEWYGKIEESVFKEVLAVCSRIEDNENGVFPTILYLKNTGNDELIGIAVLEPDFYELNIEYIYVNGTYSNGGMDRGILEQILTIAERENFKTVNMNLPLEDINMFRLFKGSKFERIEFSDRELKEKIRYFYKI